MSILNYQIVKIPDFVSDVPAFLNTQGSGSWQLTHVYNQYAYMISGSSGTTFSITGSVMPVGTVSSSAQVKTLLPLSTVSSSIQVITFLPLNTVSSSAQTIAFLPNGTVSGSTQFKTLTDPFSGSFSGSFIGLLTGNASTSTVATTLQTARLINGTSFNGSSNIIITGSYTTLTNIPVGIVSSSVQINTGSFTGSLNGIATGSFTGSFKGDVTVQHITLPLTAPVTPATGSAYFSGSFLFVWNGLKYATASLTEYKEL
jgi:hypothetical protein